jgi:hypothetical protein
MAAKHIVVHDTRNTVFWFRLMLDAFITVGAGVTSRATFTSATHMVQASALSGHLVGVLLPLQSNLSGDNLEAYKHLVHTIHIGAKWIWLGHCLLWSIS